MLWIYILFGFIQGGVVKVKLNVVDVYGTRNTRISTSYNQRYSMGVIKLSNSFVLAFGLLRSFILKLAFLLVNFSFSRRCRKSRLRE